MAHAFTLPDLGEGLTEGEIARWLVREGDAVVENEPIVEIQTDKATVEIGAPVDGVVLRILAQDGQMAEVGTTLALIGEPGERTHREIPAVTFVEECDFTGVDLDLLVATSLQAAAGALEEFPELNARIDDDEIVLLDRYDLGVAVDTEAGLVVPVVRGCDRLSVAEIDAEIERLAEGARAGTLQPDELRDSTFTVTSAGRLGGIFVTPLINHPEVAILGLHRIGPRPVARDGEVVIREIGNVSVTFDHRVVDGARAGAF